MKRKIETSLRRAMDQLPQPDYWTVAEAPVQKMEVHDYVTRQDVSVRPVRRRALPLALGRPARWRLLWDFIPIFGFSRSIPW